MCIDPYVYPGSDVLVNRFDEHDKNTLSLIEQDLTSHAILELRLNPVVGSFDALHFCEIHRRIFDEIYPFAGQYRTIPLYKEEIFLQGESVVYGEPEDIADLVDEALVQLNRIRWDDDNLMPASKEFARIITLLWQAHPFREGNTRATLVFIAQFAKDHGFELNPAVFATYPSETRDAFVDSAIGSINTLARVIARSRLSQRARIHPVLGRLNAETMEVIRLIGTPEITLAAPGQVVKGTVLATNYDAILVRSGREVVAIAKSNFGEQPINDERVNVTIRETSVAQ